MTILKAVSGSGLAIGSGVASQVTSAKVGSIIKSGNSQSYSKAPAWSAFLGMFGVFIPQNDHLVFTCSMQVFPAVFPALTIINWDVTPDPDWGEINGYLHADYGNYEDSPGTITPRQLKNITAMSMDADWTFTGSNLSGLLCECWPTTTSRPSGSLTDKVAEVGFLPKCSPSSQAFAAGLPAVGSGSFVDSFGVTWNVGLDNSQAQPYYVATRVGYVDHHGPMDFKAYFAFLQASGKLTGNEYFNGVGFGVEPLSGAGSLTINTLPTVAYS